MPSDGAAVAGVIDGGPAGTGSAILTSADIGSASGRAAISAWDEMEVVPEAAFEVDAEAGAAESEAEDGARRPSSPRAKADDPKNTNSMAATATLTSLPPDVSSNVCSSRLNNSLNMGFYWQFLLQTLRVEIGPATEITGLRALPYRRHRLAHSRAKSARAWGPKSRVIAVIGIKDVRLIKAQFVCMSNSFIHYSQLLLIQLCRLRGWRQAITILKTAETRKEETRFGGHGVAVATC